jgi:hypothetical protein
MKVVRRVRFLSAFAAFCLIVDIGVARADDSGRLTLDEENDFFAPHNLDRHYTQGIQLDYLSGDVRSHGFGRPWDWFDSWLGSPDSSCSPDNPCQSRRFDLFLGQELFTPEDKTRVTPNPRDRPYAGWVNGGVGLLRDTDERVLDHLEIQGGLVGPGASGGRTQNDFHLAIQDALAQGWGAQLPNEFTLNAYYDRHWRLTLTDDDALVSADVLPEGEAALGNAFDYAGGGGRVRIGHNLKVDYGPARIGPGPSGTDYFNRDDFAGASLWGWYVFAGSEARLVGRNMFLEGDAFRSSASVPERPLVDDLETGFAVFYSDWAKFSYSYLYRTEEFYGQRGGDTYGTINLSFHAPF